MIHWVGEMIDWVVETIDLVVETIDSIENCCQMLIAILEGKIEIAVLSAVRRLWFRAENTTVTGCRTVPWRR